MINHIITCFRYLDSMATRRALTLTSLKGEDNLEVQQIPIPEVGSGDVLVNVKFCGLNFAECSLRQVCCAS